MKASFAHCRPAPLPGAATRLLAVGLMGAGLLVAAPLAIAQSRSPDDSDPPRRSALRWPNVLDQPDRWYAGEEARRIADNVLLYQNLNGGWPKNIDMARPLSEAEAQRVEANRRRSETIIDNGATHTQIRYLALVHNAAGDPKYAAAYRRGIEFLLAAQYDNGGWPMIYPLQRGYYSHITFNDGAMVGVMRLLRDVAQAKPPFQSADEELRRRAGAAVAKGLEAMLKCQIVVDGVPTAWCAQHDEHDFSPAKARTYELPSISGQESVGVVQYLMSIDEPSPEVRAAVRHAVAWFDAAKITGMRIQRVPAPERDPPRDVVMVADPAAGPLWARFYEIGTNRPMFVGRDGVVHDRLADIEHERRMGYAYVGPWARDLLDRDYPAWQRKWGD
ncbi:MAG TPA: pectate lyase [Lacipirellulaceae bacterium]|nr:pectate lyase [Lacipirellulaceae bacterium]